MSSSRSSAPAFQCRGRPLVLGHGRQTPLLPELGECREDRSGPRSPARRSGEGGRRGRRVAGIPPSSEERERRAAVEEDPPAAAPKQQQQPRRGLDSFEPGERGVPGGDLSRSLCPGGCDLDQDLDLRFFLCIYFCVFFSGTRLKQFPSFLSVLSLSPSLSRALSFRKAPSPLSPLNHAHLLNRREP